MPRPHKTAEELAAQEYQLRIKARTRDLKGGGTAASYRPTPLQAWRQAADDVKYNRPVKQILAKLRNAKPNDTFAEFSYADCMLSEYEMRIVSNSIKAALVLPVYRTPLRVLDLRNCDIDYNKAYYLGRGLAGNCTIESLNLRNNPLTADGVAEIMKGLIASIRLLGDEDATAVPASHDNNTKSGNTKMGNQSAINGMTNGATTTLRRMNDAAHNSSIDFIMLEESQEGGLRMNNNDPGKAMIGSPGSGRFDKFGRPLARSRVLVDTHIAQVDNSNNNNNTSHANNHYHSYDNDKNNYMSTQQTHNQMNLQQQSSLLMNDSSALLYVGGGDSSMNDHHNNTLAPLLPPGLTRDDLNYNIISSYYQEQQHNQPSGELQQPITEAGGDATNSKILHVHRPTTVEKQINRSEQLSPYMMIRAQKLVEIGAPPATPATPSGSMPGKLSPRSTNKQSIPKNSFSNTSSSAEVTANNTINKASGIGGITAMNAGYMQRGMTAGNMGLGPLEADKNRASPLVVVMNGGDRESPTNTNADGVGDSNDENDKRQRREKYSHQQQHQQTLGTDNNNNSNNNHSHHGHAPIVLTNHRDRSAALPADLSQTSAQIVGTFDEVSAAAHHQQQDEQPHDQEYYQHQYEQHYQHHQLYQPHYLLDQQYQQQQQLGTHSSQDSQGSWTLHAGPLPSSSSSSSSSSAAAAAYMQYPSSSSVGIATQILTTHDPRLQQLKKSQAPNAMMNKMANSTINTVATSKRVLPNGMTKGDIMAGVVSTGLTATELLGGNISPQSSVSTHMDPLDEVVQQRSKRMPLGDIRTLHGLAEDLPRVSKFDIENNPERVAMLRERQQQENLDDDDDDGRASPSSTNNYQYRYQRGKGGEEEGGGLEGDNNGSMAFPNESIAMSEFQNSNANADADATNALIDDEDAMHTQLPVSTFHQLPLSMQRTLGMKEAIGRLETAQLHPGTVDVTEGFVNNPVKARSTEAQLERETQRILLEKQQAVMRMGGEMPEEPAAKYEPFTFVSPDARGLAGMMKRDAQGNILRHPLKYLNLSNTMMAMSEKLVVGALDLKRIPATDPRGCDALGEFLANPACGVFNLNISKNRLESAACEKLWACLDANDTLEVIGLHSTHAGPVLGSVFLGKSMGLSLSHGRAALKDERLGIFGVAPSVNKAGAASALIGYFQGKSMGSHGSWRVSRKTEASMKKKEEELRKRAAQAEEANRRRQQIQQQLFMAGDGSGPSIDSLQVLDASSTILSEGAESLLLPGEEVGEGGLAFVTRGRTGGDASSNTTVVRRKTRPPPSVDEEAAEYDDEGGNDKEEEDDDPDGTKALFKSARALFAKYLPGGPVDPLCFSERVRGVRKLNLCHTELGDIGSLAFATILLAAHRADEVERGRLRARNKKASLVAKSLKSVTLPHKPFGVFSPGSSKSSAAAVTAANAAMIAAAQAAEQAVNEGVDITYVGGIKHGLTSTVNTSMMAHKAIANSLFPWGGPNSSSVPGNNDSGNSIIDNNITHRDLAYASASVVNWNPNYNNYDIDHSAIIMTSPSSVVPAGSALSVIKAGRANNNNNNANNISHELPLNSNNNNNNTNYYNTVGDGSSLNLVEALLPSSLQHLPPFAAIMTTSNNNNTLSLPDIFGDPVPSNISGPIGTSGPALLTATTAPPATIRMLAGKGPLLATAEEDDDDFGHVAETVNHDMSRFHTIPGVGRSREISFTAAQAIPKTPKSRAGSKGGANRSPSSNAAKRMGGNSSLIAGALGVDEQTTTKGRGGISNAMPTPSQLLKAATTGPIGNTNPSLSVLTSSPSKIGAHEHHVDEEPPIQTRLTLQWLKLRGNNIGAMALRSLCRGLRLTQTLTRLDISHNPLGSAGAHILAETLAHPHFHIRELNLDNCRLTDVGRQFSGIHAILASLTVNRTLTRLTLRGNTLVSQDLSYKTVGATQEVTYSLRTIFGENRTLSFLDLRENHIKVAGQRACEEAVRAYPYVIPYATTVASLITRWMDGQLKARHLRKTQMFPSVPALLSRPPSSAPVMSVYATLEGDAATIVAAAERRTEERSKLKTDLHTLERRQQNVDGTNALQKGPGGDRRDITSPGEILRALHLTTNVMRDGGGNSTSKRGNASSSISALSSSSSKYSATDPKDIDRRLKREALHLADAATKAGGNNSSNVSGLQEVDATGKTVLLLSSLLTAAKSGKNTAEKALAFLASVEPDWLKPPPVAPPVASSSSALVAMDGKTASDSKDPSGMEPTPSKQKIALLERQGSMGGKSRSSVDLLGNGSTRRRKNRLHPRPVLKGQRDPGGSRAIGKAIQAATAKLVTNNGSAITAATSTAVSPLAAIATTFTSASVATAAPSPVASYLAASRRIISGMLDANVLPATAPSAPALPEEKTEKIVPPPTEIMLNDVDVVADRDYVIVRGSKLDGEVAIPKLDFTRLTSYAGLSPQNPYFTAQEGRDDVYAYHAKRCMTLGVSAPFKIPSEYLPQSADDEVPKQQQQEDGSVINGSVNNDDNNDTSALPSSSSSFRAGGVSSAMINQNTATTKADQKPVKRFNYGRANSGTITVENGSSNTYTNSAAPLPGKGSFSSLVDGQTSASSFVHNKSTNNSKTNTAAYTAMMLMSQNEAAHAGFTSQDSSIDYSHPPGFLPSTAEEGNSSDILGDAASHSGSSATGSLDYSTMMGEAISDEKKSKNKHVRDSSVPPDAPRGMMRRQASLREMLAATSVAVVPPPQPTVQDLSGGNNTDLMEGGTGSTAPLMNNQNNNNSSLASVSEHSSVADVHADLQDNNSVTTTFHRSLKSSMKDSKPTSFYQSGLLAKLLPPVNKGVVVEGEQDVFLGSTNDLDAHESIGNLSAISGSGLYGDVHAGSNILDAVGVPPTAATTIHGGRNLSRGYSKSGSFYTKTINNNDENNTSGSALYTLGGSVGNNSRPGSTFYNQQRNSTRGGNEDNASSGSSGASDEEGHEGAAEGVNAHRSKKLSKRDREKQIIALEAEAAATAAALLASNAAATALIADRAVKKAAAMEKQRQQKKHARLARFTGKVKGQSESSGDAEATTSTVPAGTSAPLLKKQPSAPALLFASTGSRIRDAALGLFPSASTRNVTNNASRLDTSTDDASSTVTGTTEQTTARPGTGVLNSDSLSSASALQRAGGQGVIKNAGGNGGNRLNVFQAAALGLPNEDGKSSNISAGANNRGVMGESSLGRPPRSVKSAMRGTPAIATVEHGSIVEDETKEAIEEDEERKEEKVNEEGKEGEIEKPSDGYRGSSSRHSLRMKSRGSSNDTRNALSSTFMTASEHPDITYDYSSGNIASGGDGENGPAQTENNVSSLDSSTVTSRATSLGPSAYEDESKGAGTTTSFTDTSNDASLSPSPTRKSLQQQQGSGGKSRGRSRGAQRAAEIGAEARAKLDSMIAPRSRGGKGGRENENNKNADSGQSDSSAPPLHAPRGGRDDSSGLSDADDMKRTTNNSNMIPPHSAFSTMSIGTASSAGGIMGADPPFPSPSSPLSKSRWGGRKVESSSPSPISRGNLRSLMWSRGEGGEEGGGGIGTEESAGEGGRGGLGNSHYALYSDEHSGESDEDEEDDDEVLNEGAIASKSRKGTGKDGGAETSDGDGDEARKSRSRSGSRGQHRHRRLIESRGLVPIDLKVALSPGFAATTMGITTSPTIGKKTPKSFRNTSPNGNGDGSGTSSSSPNEKQYLSYNSPMATSSSFGSKGGFYSPIGTNQQNTRAANTLQVVGGAMHSATEAGAFAGPEVYKHNPGLYSKADLASSSKKTLVPPDRIAVTSQRRTHHMRDAVAQPIHSLVQLRGVVLRNIFDFLGEKRTILVL